MTGQTADRTRVVVLAESAAQRAALSRALARPEIELFDALDPGPELVGHFAGAGVDAVVLWNDGDELLFDLLERIYISKTVLALLMVCPEPDAAVLARALECGVTAVLAEKDAEAGLADALLRAVSREKNRVTASAPAGVRASRVAAVFGTKGGTGKTTFTVNLAVALARRGARVALMDLDLQFGDVGIFLDIQKADSIADVAEENAFDYAAIKSYLFTHKSGVMGLAAPSSPEYAEIVLPEHISRAVGSLRPNFDFVMLDMPPAFHDNSIAALEAAGEIYFMLGPDISTLRNARVSMGVLDSLGLSERVHLVLNKNGASAIKARDIEKILERPVEFVIPNDQQSAIRAVNSGVPVVTGSRRSPIARAIETCASQLLGCARAPAGKSLFAKGRR
ncbi:MAG TPA: AAA family ATPase [Oscillospiraceae bacterium]|nr:AAA family ATPase [Oscillospiraceae bacterium]